MIIKKPYAFLIKHFRLIHGLLFGVLMYIFLKSMDISSFFADYVKNQYFVRVESLTSQYINYMTFFAIIVAALLVVVIGAILKLKNKNISSYIYIFCELIIAFIYLIYMFTVFKGLETQNLDIETVRNLRDISLMALLPQIIFLFAVLGRTLGFNLKQFDFKKDLEELDISDSDNEEVEVIIGNNNYKYRRFFRKCFRLTKYFLIENRLFVIGIASVASLGISLAIYMNLNVYAMHYVEQQEILANSLYYKINKSYITENDMRNSIVKKGKIYIMIEVDVQNKLNMEHTLSRETFRLEVNDELLVPTFTMTEKFMDLGTPFSPLTIQPGEDKNFIVIFELNKNDKKVDYTFKIKNYDSKKISTIESRYKNIIIKPVELDKSKDEGTYQLSANLDFKDTILKESKMNITSFEISSKFKEEYEYCIRDVCKNGTYIVNPSKTGKGDISILKINSTIELDESLYMNKHIKSPSDLIEYYGYIKYTSQGDVRTVNLTKIDVNYNKDTIAYLEVPANIEYATKLELIINIRGKKYIISLINANNNLK